jgi:hypothetical protein
MQCRQTHAQHQHPIQQQFCLQSYKVLCICVVKQIRTMKRPSSIEYLDALKENKKDKMCVFVCVMHSKKVVNKSIPLLKFLQNVNF